MEPKTCNKCGETRPTTAFYKRKASSDGLAPWCKECYRQWHRDRYTPKFTPPAVMTCEWCSSEYESKQRRTSKYCNPNCRQRATWWRNNPRESRACAECGADITERRRSTVYCSDTCSRSARAARQGPDHRRKWRMTNKYGITVEDYDRMVEAQGDRCAVCGTNEPGGRVPDFWCIDHCHADDRVRGLLCNQCNLALGLMADDADRLRSAAAYIESHNT